MLKLAEELRKNPKFTKDRSITWFKDKIRELGVKERDPRILRDTKSVTTQLRIGDTLMYTYDPKYKDTLPYYDIFPMTLVFAVKKETFFGINFHYLPVSMRLVLYDKLIGFATNKNLTDQARLRVTWELLNRAATSRYVQPAVKQYLYSHIRSRLIRVPLDDLKIAMHLPVQGFRKAKETYVWSQTRKQVGSF